MCGVLATQAGSPSDCSTVCLSLSHREGAEAATMTGLWMPAMLEDSNANVDLKGETIFSDTYVSHDTTSLLSNYSTLTKYGTLVILAKIITMPRLLPLFGPLDDEDESVKGVAFPFGGA